MYEVGSLAVYGEHEPHPAEWPAVRLVPYVHPGAYPWFSASTQAVLRRMATMDLSGRTVLDFGCGASAILALAAARLGASRVVACDHAADQLPIATSQVEANGLTGVIEVVAEDPGGDFDVILANVGDAALLAELAPRAGVLLGTARARQQIQERPGQPPRVELGWEDLGGQATPLDGDTDFALVEL